MNFTTSGNGGMKSSGEKIQALKNDADRAKAFGTGAVILGISSTLLAGIFLPSASTAVAAVAALSGLASGISVYRKIQDENAIRENLNGSEILSSVTASADHN